MEGANEAPPPAPVHMEDSTAKPSLETGGRHPRASALNTDLGSDSKLGSSCTGPADRCTWLGPAGPGEAVGGRARTKAAVDTAPQGSQTARHHPHPFSLLCPTPGLSVPKPCPTTPWTLPCSLLSLTAPAPRGLGPIISHLTSLLPGLKFSFSLSSLNFLFKLFVFVEHSGSPKLHT